MKQSAALVVAVIGCASLFVASCNDDPSEDKLDASLDSSPDSPRDSSPDSPVDLPIDSPTDAPIDSPLDSPADSPIDSSPDRRSFDSSIDRLIDSLGPPLDGSFDTSKESPLDASSCLDGSVCTDAGMDANVACGTTDTAPFIENARNAVCASVQNRLSIVDCSMVFWSVRGTCSDASYAYMLFGATVDDVLCSYMDSITGPRYYSKSPVCETLFQTMIKAPDKPDLNLGSGHTVTDIPF